MATPPLRLVLLLSFLVCTFSVSADTELRSDGEEPAAPEQDPALLLELHNLKSQYQELEESALDKDRVIYDKEQIISALRETLKKKEGLQDDNDLTELGSKITQLEDDLKSTELALEESRSKIKNLEDAQALQSSKIKELEKVVSEQKRQISKAEKALRVAESTLLRVQQEAEAKDKELRKVHGGWLPPWTSIKLAGLQGMAADQWRKHGQPLVDRTVDRASSEVSAAQKWASPYFEKLKSHAEENWSPAFKRSTTSVSALVSPHLETAKSKVQGGYEASKEFFSPHFQKVQDVMGPRIQVARETCRPYVEETASFIRPYYEEFHSLTKPYTNKWAKGYRKILTSATTYHNQLQTSIKEKLEKVEFIATLASSELVWFLSAALLVLPPLFICMFLSSALSPSKKPIRASKSHHGGHLHKKPKRAKQVDK